jgi:riboflavin kinase/FMN adenylyltransferase
MKVISIAQAKQIQFDNVALALGTFDGLHIGHMALINAAKQAGAHSAVFTFDSLPADYFYGEHRPMRLMTLDEKITAFEKAGVDYLCLTHFDKKLAGIDKDKFSAMLHDIFNPVAVIAGYNYTYGKDAKGDADTLIMAGERYGFRVQVIQPVISDGEPVSATRIRECIESGHVERAAKLLGYSYALTGKVGTGRRIGTNKLGFPTANLISPPEKIIPLRGVYGVTVNAEGSEYKGVCNIGVNPTVSNGARETIETHIIGMSDDLYDKIITINFEKRIRGEKKFSSIHELKTQIQRDIDSL